MLRSGTIDPHLSALRSATSFGLFLFILVCLKADGIAFPETRYTMLLYPLWVSDVVLISFNLGLLVASLVLDIPGINACLQCSVLFRFALLCAFELAVSLRVDGVISSSWGIVFVPIFIWEAIALFSILPFLCMSWDWSDSYYPSIQTVEEAEARFGKPFTEFSEAQKADFYVSLRIDNAKWEILTVLVRVAIYVLFILQLDTDLGLNLPLTFWLLFLVSFTISCCSRSAEIAGIDSVNIAGSDGISLLDAESQEMSTQYGSTPQNVGKMQFWRTMETKIFYFFSQITILFCALLLLLKLQGASFSYLWIPVPIFIPVGIGLCGSGLIISLLQGI